MELLGAIKRVQIQRDNLKLGTIPNRVYHTDPLLVVDALKITPRGTFGMMADGAKIIDVHHIDHPESRNRGNDNGVSINFTGHYAKMRGKYGDHMLDGVAGENILVDVERIVTLDDLGAEVIIENSLTGDKCTLGNVMIAVPCVEFTYYVLQERAKGKIIKDTLQFVSDGIRGFYMTLTDGQTNPTIQVGDRVYVSSG